MSLFKEIEEELRQAPDTYKVPIETFFLVCQDYYWNYQINETCSEVISVVQNYLEDDECIAKRNNGSDNKRMRSLGICSKFHIEFIWNAYKFYNEEKLGEKTESQFFVEIIECVDRKEKIGELLGINDDEILVRYIDEVISSWLDYTKSTKIEDLNLDKLHNAMIKIGEAFHIDKPTIEESVEDIILPDVLEELLEALRIKNYPRALFLIAPITRAMTEGAINSFTPKNKEKTKYFTMNFMYNLRTLLKRVNGLKRLLEDYMETTELLKQDWKKCIKK